MGNTPSININLPTLNIRRQRSNSMPSNLAGAGKKPRRRSRSRRLRLKRPFARDDDVEGTGAASAGHSSDDESDSSISYRDGSCEDSEKYEY